MPNPASAPAASPAPVAPASTLAAVAGSVAERWRGKWNGPEGTWLAIEPDGTGWKVTVSNLDGPRSFPARVDGDRLRFQRDGVDETIHAGNGDDTGMKWLADRKDCLVIRSGEGFCRR